MGLGLGVYRCSARVRWVSFRVMVRVLDERRWVQMRRKGDLGFGDLGTQP